MYISPKYEVSAMLNFPCLNIRDYRTKALFMLLYISGLRIGEVSRLDRHIFDEQRLEFDVIGKGKRHRLVFIDSDTLRAINEYLAMRKDDNPALFVSTRKNRLSIPRMQKTILGRRKAIGLTKEITCHTYRHTFATHLLENGADIYAIKDLLGHKFVATTEIYLSNSNARLRQTHNLLHVSA